ncbi:MAG: lactate dehydrogenase, partial [Bosea sp. (in: a-proteobacteria)]|nr:lactate dehydrogenase [Bosea sp. (in: a-proteobacteria)]
MAQDHRLNLDPFTIDLFNETALSSGLSLGVAAFARDVVANDDDDPEPTPPSPAQQITPSATRPSALCRGVNFVIDSDRCLSTGWKDRAHDSIAAIRIASQIEAEQRPATLDEQRRLIRFTGFGASDLANGVFLRPGETAFRKGWETIGGALQDAVSDADYASLARCTQYAHFTPEFIVRAIWAGLQR